MEIATEVLQKALKRCVIAVAPRPGIYTPDAIQADGEYLYAFNDAIGVKVKCPMPTIFSVSGAGWSKLVDSFTGDKVTITVEEDEVVIGGQRNGRKIKSRLTKADDRVKARYEEIYPWDPELRNLPPQFCESLAHTLIQSTSKFAGSFLAGEYITTADRRYAMRVFVDGTLEDTWLSPVMAKAVVQFGGVNRLELRSAWAHFFTPEGDTISVRKLLDASYPLKKVYSLFTRENEFDIVSGSFTRELIDSVKKAMVFTEAEEDGAVALRMTFTTSEVKIYTSRKDTEYFEDVPGTFLVAGADEVVTTVDGMALKKVLLLMRQPDFKVMSSEDKVSSFRLEKDGITAVIAAE